VLLPCITIMNNMKLKRESKRKTRFRFTWFDNVPTFTRVWLYSIMIRITS